MRKIARFAFQSLLAVVVATGMATAASVQVGDILQVSGSTDVVAGLVTQGLRAATSNPAMNLGTGAVTCGSVTGSTTLALAGAAGSSSAGSGASLKGGAGNGTNQNSGGLTETTGAPTGTGTGNYNVQSGWTLASGTTAQTMGDRFFVAGHNITMSNTTATATTIAVLNVPTATSGGGCIIFYEVIASDGTNIDTTTGSFCVSCSNKAGVVTATAGALTGAASNGNSGSVAAGTISTTISSQAVSIKIAPAYTTIVPTGVTTTVTAFAFGNGVTVTAQ